MDARDQLVLVERLGEVVVGAEAQALHLVLDAGHAGQDQDRRLDLRHAQRAQHLVARHVGQVQIEEDDVVVVQLTEIDTLFPEVGGVGVEVLGLEHQLDALRDGSVVFDQQNAHDTTSVRGASYFLNDTEPLTPASGNRGRSSGRWRFAVWLWRDSTRGMALPDPDGLDALSLSELRGLVVGLIGQVRSLTDENRALRDEVARLKGLPPRPPTRPTPSGMEAASERAQADPGKRRRRGPVQDRCVVTREVVLKAAVPEGSRFKGYEDLVVRDLVLEAVVIRYRRERWCTPSGSERRGPAAARARGGFGPHLRRFLLAAHVQGQVTSERLTAMLSGLGLTISKRQVVRLLSGPLDPFVAEDQAVLRAGLGERGLDQRRRHRRTARAD